MATPALPLLLERFDACVESQDLAWLLEASVRAHAEPEDVLALLGEVARRFPSAELGDEAAPWTTDDVARLVLLRACGSALGGVVPRLYRQGDDPLRRVLIVGLPLLPLRPVRQPLTDGDAHRPPARV